MKEISMDGMRLIHSGDDWDHARPPCSKDMTGFLEHNEKIVSWVQPLSGGVDDQIPVVRYNGAYYRLSLRMMKSVWRHIRLKKGFVNREAAPYGGVKLRIPQLLFLEKKRTQARFNVSALAFACVARAPSGAPAIKRKRAAGDAHGLVGGHGRRQGSEAGAERVQQDLVRGAPGAAAPARGRHPAPRLLSRGESLLMQSCHAIYLPNTGRL